ncbi:MAG: hypothetical protein WKF31_02155 [Thermoleophilaceae bacterium]
MKEVQEGTREDGGTGGGETGGGSRPAAAAASTGARQTAAEGEGSEAIVAGDLNAFEDEEPLEILEEEGDLDNLCDEEEEELRYSFQFQGKLQTLDHILVTDGLNEDLQAFQYAHFNVDYFEREAPGTGTPTTDGHKLSVHDPPIFTLGPVGDDGNGGGDGGSSNGKRNDGNGNGKRNGNEGNGNGNGNDSATPEAGGVLGVQAPVFGLRLEGVRSCSRSRGRASSPGRRSSARYPGRSA